MAKIFVTRPIPGDAVERLKEKGHEVKINPENNPLSAENFKKELSEGNYDGVISLLHDKIDSEIFNAAPSVKIFANYAVGFNNIDIEEARKRGVVITNTPCVEVNESVAEHTLALILSLTSRVVEGDKYVRAGHYRGWDPNLLIGVDVRGKTLGVIGAGRIGTFVIEKAFRGFGMGVVYYDVVRNERAEKEFGAKFANNIEEVLKQADVVTLHVFLNDSTKHLINKERIGLMKKDAYIVNTSRGAVIEEKALVEALQSGKLRGAALDVFENEPNLSPGLTDLTNVVLTPHIASSTEFARDKMSEIAATSIIEFFEGKKPTYQVN